MTRSFNLASCRELSYLLHVYLLHATQRVQVKKMEEVRVSDEDVIRQVKRMKKGKGEGLRQKSGQRVVIPLLQFKTAQVYT